MAAKKKIKNGQVLARPRTWLGDGHEWNNLHMYLAMYEHFANFGGMLLEGGWVTSYVRGHMIANELLMCWLRASIASTQARVSGAVKRNI